MFSFLNRSYSFFFSNNNAKRCSFKFFMINNNIYLFLFKLLLIGFCTSLKSKNQLHLLLKHQKKLRMLYQFESWCILKKAKEKSEKKSLWLAKENLPFFIPMENNEFPVKNKQIAINIDGIKTEILLQGFSDKIFIVVTQYGKIGSLVKQKAWKCQN